MTVAKFFERKTFSHVSYHEDMNDQFLSLQDTVFSFFAFVSHRLNALGNTQTRLEQQSSHIVFLETKKSTFKENTVLLG